MTPFGNEKGRLIIRNVLTGDEKFNVENNLLVRREILRL